MNAVIYARFSSYGQTEQSIEGQIRVCREYAEHNGLTVVKEYIERAKTGTNDKRPVFLQMIEDAKNKGFEKILVYKFDRFARNQYDSVIYKHTLKQYGVKVVSATEGISDTPEGKLMEGLLEMFAEMYSKDLSQKVKRGIRESILKGNYIGGHILYGYKVVDKKIVIDETTAPAIRYFFEEYANGKSKKQIIRELNAKGYTIHNKPITMNSFQNNLRNPKYAGIFDNGILKNDSYYPAIISKELFDRVQVKLAEHKHQPATQTAKVEYLLTGKAFCGYCGSSIVGASGTGKLGKRHSYYACSKRWKQHACQKKNEQKDYLERYVVEQTLNYVLTPEHIEEIATGFMERWNKSTTTQQIKEFERRIAQVESELDKCFNLLLTATNEDMQKRLNEKANSLTIQKQDLEKELQKLQVVKIITHTKDEVKNLIARFVDGNIDSLEYQRKIINYFVNSVYIFDDKTAIYYTLFGKRKISFEEATRNIAENEQANSVLTSNGTPRQCIRSTNTAVYVFFDDIFGLIIKR